VTLQQHLGRAGFHPGAVRGGHGITFLRLARAEALGILAGVKYSLVLRYLGPGDPAALGFDRSHKPMQFGWHDNGWRSSVTLLASTEI
jgi:hypothetical protein